MRRVRIYGDRGHGTTRWWDAAKAASDVPEAIQAVVAAGPPYLVEEDEPSACVSAREAARIRRWASRLPGWGPTEGAPHPLDFESCA